MGSGTSKAAPTPKVTVRGQEVRLFAGDAHPVSLAVLDLIKEADAADSLSDFSGMLGLVRQAAQLIKDVPEDAAEHLSVLVFQREGYAYERCRNLELAKAAYGKAIQIAEMMVAEHRPRIYMVLQRYCDAVMALSSLWEKEGTKCNKKMVTTTATGQQARAHKEAGIPKPSHEQGDRDKSLLPLSDREVRMAAVQIYGPCEMALLRCIEVTEKGDHRQSDLLILPLLELSRIYEALKIFPRAVLVIRRCIGILCVRYGHDHMRLIDLNARCERLIRLRDEQILEEAVVKLQSLARMFAAMHRLEATLHRPVRRHKLPSRGLRGEQQTRNGDFLNAYATLLWHKSSASLKDVGGSAVASSSNVPRGATSPIQGATSPSKRGLPPPSPTATSLSFTSNGPSRPTSSVAIGMRQTALINAGFASSFIRSSFAVGNATSRPESAQGLPPITSRPQSGTGHGSPSPVVDQRQSSAAAHNLRLSLAALSVSSSAAVTSSSSTLAKSQEAGADSSSAAVKRSRLKSWAAHDLSQ